MTDYSGFRHGGSSFPLATDTTSSLLLAADPAIYYTLEYLSFCITKHVGGLLMREAASCGANQIAQPVQETLPFNPEPWLTEDHVGFPLLAAYRKSSKTKDVGAGKHTLDEVDVLYILPPLQAGEAERLLPVLKAVANVVDNRVQQGMDPGYTPTGTSTAGTHVWETAGVATAEYKGASFGIYDGTDGLPFPVVICHLELLERSDYDYTELNDFAGESFTIDVADTIQQTVSDFIEVDVHAPPTLTSLLPTTGSKAGGTSVTLTGTGFVVGTTPTVHFGGIAATSVVVTSATTATCVTPAHTAYDTFAADVEYVAADGQSDTLDASFTFTTP